MKIDKFECASSTVVATTSDTSSNKKEAAENGAKIQMVKSNPEQPKNNKPKIKPKEVKSIKNSTEQISKKTVNVKKTTSNNTSSSPVAKKISKKIKNNENLGKENSSNNKVNKVKVPFDFKAQKQKRLSPALAVICGKKIKIILKNSSEILSFCLMKLDKPNALKYSIVWENIIKSCLHRSGHSLEKNLM